MEKQDCSLDPSTNTFKASHSRPSEGHKEMKQTLAR